MYVEAALGLRLDHKFMNCHYHIYLLEYLFIYLFTGINKAKPVNPDPMYVTDLC